jgi:hypothetical protein
LPQQLIKDAIAGKYDYSVFKPRFISREEFFEKKDTDPYIKYIWSFGNRGITYMFGRKIEKDKEAIHNYVVFGEKSERLLELCPNVENVITADNIKERRLQWMRHCNKKVSEVQLNMIEALERLQQLNATERLQRLCHCGQLKFKCSSYTDYKYEDGDVVYCDVPYKSTGGYGQPFNHKEFYDWVASRPYPVYFSSYEISDDRFYKKKVKETVTTFSPTSNNMKRTEWLYSNRPFEDIKENEKVA